MLQKYRTVLPTSPELSAASLGSICPASREAAFTSCLEREAHRLGAWSPRCRTRPPMLAQGSSGALPSAAGCSPALGSPETAGAPRLLSLPCLPVGGKLAATGTLPLLHMWGRCLAPMMPDKGFVSKAAHGEPVSAAHRSQAAPTARAPGPRGEVLTLNLAPLMWVQSSSSEINWPSLPSF